MLVASRIAVFTRVLMQMLILLKRNKFEQNEPQKQGEDDLVMYIRYPKLLKSRMHKSVIGFFYVHFNTK